MWSNKEREFREEVSAEVIKKELTEAVSEDVSKLVEVSGDILSDVFFELIEDPKVDILHVFERLKKEYELNIPWVNFSDGPLRVEPTYLVNIPFVADITILTRTTQEFELPGIIEKKCVNCKHIIGVTIPIAPSLTPSLPIKKGCSCEKPEVIKFEKGYIPCVSGLAGLNYYNKYGKEVKTHIEYVAVGNARTEITGGRNKVLAFITRIPKKKKEYKVYVYRLVILHVFNEEKEKLMNNDEEKYGFSINEIVNYFAPMVVGYEDKKLLLLLQLIGAGYSTIEDLDQRFWINLLMIGDPSTAKSILAREVTKVFRKVTYTSLAGSTIPGLFAGRVEGSVQFGPLVLLDGDGLSHGILILSECEKINDKQQKELIPILLQSMEDGYVSRNIAGLDLGHTTRCGVLFVSNWRHVYYMPNQSFMDNLPTLFTHGALLDRIDGFLLFKQPPPDILKEVMKGLLLKFKRGSVFRKEIEQCRKYVTNVIESARRIKVELTSEVHEKIDHVIDSLLELLKKYSIRGLDARRVMSIIRLATAFAKLMSMREVRINIIEKIFDLMLLQIKLIEDSRALLIMFARTEKTPSLLKFYMDFYDFLLSIATEKDGKYLVDLVTIYQRFRQYLEQLSTENPRAYDNVMYIIRNYFSNKIERAIEETIEYLKANGLVAVRDSTNKVYEVITSFDDKLKDMFSFSRK